MLFRSKIKVEDCMWKHTEHPNLAPGAQKQTLDCSPTEKKRIKDITTHYSRRKHQAITGDKQALRDGIKLVTQELHTKPFGDTAL